MRWDNSAWALLQYIDFVREQKEIVTGRGIKFTRTKSSQLQLQKKRPHHEVVMSPVDNNQPQVQAQVQHE